MSAPHWFFFPVLTLGVVLSTLGCSGEDDGGRARPEGGGGALSSCEDDEDCDDGNYCNGQELCDPTASDADGRGCAAREVPCTRTGLECDETEARCVANCDVTEDADGDGSVASDCGGDDCDDADGNRYPGNQEVCDVEDHDEDCDPSTYGVRDQDGDGAPDASCCNVGEEGDLRCGTDCDDTSAGTHPNVPEVCDGMDNDCNGDVDEGVTRSVYLDEDGDGYGDPRFVIEASCGEQEGVSENGHDCDDSSAAVAPGAVELCDGIDNNCDGIYERDLDQDGHLEPGAVCVDGDLPLDDCNNLDATTYLGAAELCDGYDNDCDGVRDDAYDAARACSDSDDLAGAFCLDRSCEVVACATDFGNCNGSSLDGCEVDVSNDEEHCGACGTRCPLGTTCEDGVCSKTTLVGVAVGTDHACAVSAAGGVGCWGGNGGSQLGNGKAGAAGAMVNVAELDGVAEIAAGDGHSCALSAAGEVYCWGQGVFSQLGFSDTATRAIPALVGEGFESIRSSGWGNCGQKGGQTWCWGREMGLLEGRSMLPSVVPYSGSTAASAVNRFSQCALLATGHVECSGDVLTAGDFDVWSVPPRCFYAVPNQEQPAQFYCVPSPEEVPGVSNATHVSGICMIEDDAVLCLSGNGVEQRISAAMTGSTVTKLSANEDGDVCALYESGEVVCSLPYVSSGVTAIVGLSGPATDVSVGEEATCFIADGELSCIGAGPVVGEDPGQLSGGFVVVPPAADFLSIDPQSRCVRTSEGTVLCPGSSATSFEPVAALESALSLEGSDDFSCALFFDSSVGCVGANDAGQLGSSGGEEFRFVDIPSARQIASNGRGTCATTLEGEVWCWGEASFGNLGEDAPEFGSALLPTPVPSLGEVVSVGLGAEFACALDIGGGVHCWGRGDQGQLGDETGQSSRAPVPVALLSQVIQLEVGAEFACALRYDGSVFCWGSDQLGQLGQGGTLGQVRYPIQVPGLSGIASITLGDAHACALHSDGSVFCWGSNSVGQIGAGILPTEEGSLEPVTLVADLRAGHVVARGENTCAITFEGTPLCWGRDVQQRFMMDEPFSCTMTAYDDSPQALFVLCPEPAPVEGL